MDLLALIEKLEKEYPCVGDHETDARDTYPNRWQALKEAAQQNVQPTGCYACTDGIIRCDGIAANCPVCNPATSG